MYGVFFRDHPIVRCPDCNAFGVVCATPVGEVFTKDCRLEALEGLEEAGLRVLCASAHEHGDAVCDDCETDRNRMRE